MNFCYFNIMEFLDENLKLKLLYILFAISTYFKKILRNLVSVFLTLFVDESKMNMSHKCKKIFIQ
ncbi:hypothetical protein PB1_16534 [Bacillus methanolicus PB1]|uniref:Uncharacterized protein n=1 Tax=Bacillus methanolicus PB1 TaxID=997296 RepID=I3DY61_BACMT|nr:hypothetical protein PB1_16534 [Bacillus methanolicus PB1]